MTGNQKFDVAAKVDLRLWPFDCSELIKTNWFEAMRSNTC